MAGVWFENVLGKVYLSTLKDRGLPRSARHGGENESKSHRVTKGYAPVPLPGISRSSRPVLCFVLHFELKCPRAAFCLPTIARNVFCLLLV